MIENEMITKQCENCEYLNLLDGSMECIVQEERDYFGIFDDQDCPCYIPLEEK